MDMETGLGIGSPKELFVLFCVPFCIEVITFLPPGKVCMIDSILSIINKFVPDKDAAKRAAVDLEREFSKQMEVS